jgi:pimeloyl-ACP methyl ester carboxylesterase
MVATPAGRIHLVEAGTGPLVLLLHGFPEGWYSWRHQLPALAEAGYRAVALDVRGYGRSSKPADPNAYRLIDQVADNVAVVDELEAIVIGHDWGSPIAATSALLHPSIFSAVGLLSVPYSSPGGPRPSAVFAGMGDDPQFYVAYFQQPGVAEAEIEPDVRGWLTGFYAALAGDTSLDPDTRWFQIPRGRQTMRARFPAGAALPAWLTPEDIEVYAGDFERTGFTGALNCYRFNYERPNTASSSRLLRHPRRFRIGGPPERWHRRRGHRASRRLSQRIHSTVERARPRVTGVSL